MASKNSQNDMKPIDVGAGRLIPQGNLNPDQPGSFGAMMKDYENSLKSSSTFNATTSGGFRPGWTIFGKRQDFGSATFS